MINILHNTLRVTTNTKQVPINTHIINWKLYNKNISYVKYKQEQKYQELRFNSSNNSYKEDTIAGQGNKVYDTKEE